MREFANNAVPRQLPERWAQEAEQHEAIASLLGAYVDGELPAETMAQLDGHLAACPRCSREVSLQRALAAGLGQTRGPVVSAALQTRIRQAVAAAPAPVASPSPRPRRLNVFTFWRTLALLAVLGAGGLLGRRFIGSRSASRPAAPAVSVATIGRDALLDSLAARWSTLASQDLPGRARDLDAVRGALGVPVTPLDARGLTLASAWTTGFAGELVGALAYRRDGQLLLHFIVPAAVAAPNGSLRGALDRATLVTGASDSLVMVAWRAPGGIHVLVGRDTPDALRALATSQPSANSGGAERH